MSFSIDSRFYADYIQKVSLKILSEKEYITALDAATGDGDHWVNMNMGFKALSDIHDELANMEFSDMLKKIGMTVMSVVGGSSGILYGSAYIGIAKVMTGKVSAGREELGQMLTAMIDAIMKRGNSEPGQKTMIDTLYIAREEYCRGLSEDLDDMALLEKLKNGAKKGADSTRDMAAIRGRACYQANKGVGHLDPGAVTMQYQIEILADCIKNALAGE